MVASIPRAPAARPLGRQPGRVHHVAVVVRSIEAALPLYRDLLGLALETVLDVTSDHVRIAFLGVGESKVELVEPTDDTTGVARFLANRGEGFHHVCFEVANLTEELTRLGIEGVELIDTAPRHGAEGPVAFLHPRSCHGVLVELIEATGGPAWRSLGYPTADGPVPTGKRRTGASTRAGTDPAGSEASRARPAGGQARRPTSRKRG